MEKVRCGKCRFRASTYAEYLCDYAGITGRTRMAVPPERCRHFQPDRKPPPPPPADLEAKARRKRKPVYDWDKGRALYDQGMTDKEISEHLNCTDVAVWAWRRREGLPPVPRRSAKP